MNRPALLAAAVLLVALTLEACKGSSTGAKVAGSPSGATAGAASKRGGDGQSAASSVTAPNAASGAGPAVGATGAPGASSADRLGKAALGGYTFHEKVTSDGGSPHERDFAYDLTDPDGMGHLVSWIERDPTTGAGSTSGDRYTESHDPDGLFLLSSVVVGTEECRWQPKSVELPQTVINGGSAASDSACTVTLQGRGTKLRLQTSLKFSAVRAATFAGVSHRCIDVARHRVLTGDFNGPFTITSDAVDTYAFDLGIRVQTADRSTTKSTLRTQSSTRSLVLTQTP